LKPVTFVLNPTVTYIDDLGQTRTSNTRKFTINVQPAKPDFEVLPGRVATGYGELDKLLFGGIPEKYAVALAAPPVDEREILINHFLKTGAEAGETTFYITVEPENARALAEKYQSNFYVFICCSQADTALQNLPNVYKLKGVENLTEIDIALTKACRELDPSAAGHKRACIQVTSDVLLQHHALISRKWLGSLIANLKSKGFTALAVVNPSMHSPEEMNAIMDLFDGEIRITEEKSDKGRKKILEVVRLYNKRFSEEKLTLTKEGSL